MSAVPDPTAAPLHYTERALQFECAGDSLVGILTQPQEVHGTRAGLGIVIIVGGPQYRAGSHRQFVRLARALAESGHAVLRFDHRGMGDSSGAARDFLSIDDDIGAAIDAMMQTAPAVRRIALFGLCDAAAAALLYWNGTRDPRVERLVVLNPWVRSELGLARTQVRHYYLQRLSERAFWSKLLSGKVALGALAGLLRNLRAALFASAPTRSQDVAPHFSIRMAQAWEAFEGGILLLLSGNDYTAREFTDLVQRDPLWQKALQRRAPSRRDLAQANHTFSEAADARLMEQYTVEWLGKP